MSEPQDSFEYSWEDLAPVRPLLITMIVAQIVGAGLGLWLESYPFWFNNLWTGAALATFPGFLIGVPIQVALHPRSLTDHRSLIRRMGFIALVVSLAVFVVPFGEEPAR